LETIPVFLVELFVESLRRELRAATSVFELARFVASALPAACAF
jgi:hypothetical protein